MRFDGLSNGVIRSDRAVKIFKRRERRHFNDHPTPSNQVNFGQWSLWIEPEVSTCRSKSAISHRIGIWVICVYRFHILVVAD